MNLDDILKNVTVIGAAGKMGSGISALLAQELANCKIKNPNAIYRLNLVDVNDQALDGLRKYIRSQLIKAAEKAIVRLRADYADREDLVENHEIINAYAEEGLGLLRFSNDFTIARNSHLIFEAVFENEELKLKILKELKTICRPETLYFTNTSSIPVGFLAKESGLEGKIVGYHFYNPPIVQKLVEIISAEGTPQEYINIAHEFGKRLRKKCYQSNDIAGFIGNGHFMRDGLHALAEVDMLQGIYSLPEALYIMNQVTQNFLIRPMGIFQLIDYVGLDVFQCILRVMSKHLNDDSLHSDLIDTCISHDVKGGQRSDGSQKDGFFKYAGSKLVGIYNAEKKMYEDFAPIQEKIDNAIGTPPEGFYSWKQLLKDPDKEQKLAAYFTNLASSEGLGAELAKSYLARSKEIGKKLVTDGVAKSEEDVNAVLMNGFFWLYGPINDYV